MEDLSLKKKKGVDSINLSNISSIKHLHFHPQQKSKRQSWSVDKNNHLRPQSDLKSSESLAAWKVDCRCRGRGQWRWRGGHPLVHPWGEQGLSLVGKQRGLRCHTASSSLCQRGLDRLENKSARLSVWWRDSSQIQVGFGLVGLRLVLQCIQVSWRLWLRFLFLKEMKRQTVNCFSVASTMVMQRTILNYWINQYEVGSGNI